MRKLYLTAIGILIACAGIAQTDTILAKIPDTMKLSSLPTYDGTGQAVHSDILYFKNGKNGHYFYMTMTPYAASNGNIENPSILVSENGYTFYEEVPGMNPLAQKPPYANAHNDDPDIIWNAPTNEFYLYYLETNKYSYPQYQKLQLLKSSDGKSWTSSTAVNYNLANGDVFIVSPSVVKKDSIYYLYYVNIDVTPYKIQYSTSKDGLTWDKAVVNNINITFPTNVRPWHMNILDDGAGTYYMLCDGYTSSTYTQHYLYIGTSTDMVNWNLKQTPLIQSGSSFYSSDAVYRGSGIINKSEDYMIIYVSYVNLHGTSPDEWRIVIKKFNNLSSIIAEVDEKTISSLNLHVYPNPSDGVFNVSTSGLKDDIKLSVINLQGQEIYSNHFNGNVQQQIDISNYPNGVYFVKITGTDFIKVEKVIVQ